ncbi:EI24 domain-containing protein [Halocynthiibacter sp. C4]|uniref:EI24 domain-containing protein n=1 Tax=Halocynthiibacter sp. C4 TaxID=2992758 RepID=UPI00237AB1DF|nr:EI24 domain-containing protein [Halocynthiibacter sp. C4]MDE0590248.1 EI24 domain-containing protein [Halocynthiibacter sp. C4]
MISSFLKSLAQLSDRRFRNVIWKGVGLSLLLLAAIYALFVTGLSFVTPDTITLPLVGEITIVQSLITWGSFLLMMVLSVFLMFPVASAFTGLFLDEVSEAVEDRHYPALPPAQGQPIGDVIVDTANFLGLMIGLNIIGLIVFPFTGPFAPLCFFGMNGFLLGREYFQMVAMRRMDRKDARALHRDNGLTIWVAGGLMAVPLAIPVVNLLVPVLAAATFTHIFEAVKTRQRV